jgi:HD-GYP domain-containing protein (c-di-GMP phosphodiesterase class II)
MSLQTEISKYLDSLITIDNLIDTLEKISVWHDIDIEHGQRVAATSVAIGKKSHLNDEELVLIEYAGRIHDLGRVGIDDTIMAKPGKFTTAQRAAMETHVRIGYNFLSRSNLPEEITHSVLYHHEHWDGSGYPKGLVKSEIPLFSRIICIADVWDALTSDRPYRPALSHQMSMEIMTKSIEWFDPKLYGKFLEIIGEKNE